MRWRTRRAVVGYSCQIGRSVSMTSALVTSQTGILPMCGNTNRARLDFQLWACLGPHSSRGCSSRPFWVEEVVRSGMREEAILQRLVIEQARTPTRFARQMPQTRVGPSR